MTYRSRNRKDSEMSEEQKETFEVSPAERVERVERRETVAERKCLHVTIIDHNPIVEGTGDVSHVELKIPLSLVEAGLRMIPQGKLGNIDPALIVQMVETGAEGDIVKIDEEKKSIHIRVE